MFKKIVISLMTVMVAAVPVQALCLEESVSAAEPDYSIAVPYNISVQYNIPELSITSGVAECTVEYKLHNPSYTASCQIILESSSNKTSWSRVASWTLSGSNEEYYSKEKTLPTPLAKYYRVRSVLTVYNTSGTQVEKVEAISNIV